MSDFSFSPSHACRPLWRCLAALALAAAACSLAVPQAVAQPLAQRWLTTYGDPSGSYDEGDIVRNSPDGNVVVAGVSTFGHNQNFSNLANIRTAKYDGATGALIWQARSTGPYGDTVSDMAVDSAGNAIVVGARMDQYDINAHAFYVAKYAAADGTLLWERSFTPRSFFTGVVIDAQDNVIATGVQRTTDSSPIDSDIETCKFNGTTGETIWDNVYTGVQFASATTDGAQALALDTNGNVFVTGYAENSNWQFPECVVLKLAGDTGTNLWTVNRRIDGASGSSGMDVVVGPDGSPVVAVNTPQGFGGLRVIKFQGTDGTELWINTQDGPQRDLPAGLVMDSKGDVILTGSTLGNGVFQYDIFTRKIKGTDGTSIWTQVFDSGFTKDDEGVAIALDPNDNPVVAGYSSPQQPYGPDNMILKYSGVDGTPLLQQRVPLSEDSDNPENRHGLAVGPGHITVTGFVYPYPNPNRDPGNAYLFRLNDPSPATVATAAASDVASRAATLNGTVNPNGGVVTVHFDYGTAPDNLASSTPVQALTSNFQSQAVTAPLSGLIPDTKYYYRISSATAGGGMQTGEVLSFTTQGESVLLASLSVSGLELTPVFDSATASYAVSVPSTLSGVTVTATPQSSSATVQVNGVTVVAGQPSGPIPVGGTSGTITIVVSGSGKTQTYTVTTLPQDFVFNSAGDVPVSSAGLPPGDFPATVTLGFTPAPGTSLTMVRNTGLGFDAASFGGLTQGQVVTLAYGGANYRFVVNYYGGSGNDLVLQWADTIAAGWGSNDQGQLGAATGRGPWLSPTKIPGVGKDRGVTLFATSAGYLHSLALDSDGVVSAWGSNLFGALGTGDGVSHAAPAAVDARGVLAGKRVVAIAAGGFHSLALGSDGTIVAWGYNNFGQLGNGTTTTSGVPVAVDVSGALAGKTVVEIATGQYHSLALCSDGTLVTWGLNGSGALGDGTTTNRPVPVAVDLSGATSPVTSIAAGGNQSFALLQDGSLLAWGFNDHGQLGDGTTTTRLSPVPVTVAGPLTDRKVTGIAAGYAHTVVLLNDRTLAAWGMNDRGQLGDGTNGDRLVPVTVSAGALAGKTVVSTAAGKDYTLALCADGTLAAWGANAEGELGQGGGGDSNLPVSVLPDSFGTSTRFSGVASSFAGSQHVLATVALPESSAPSALQIKGSPVPVTLAEWRLAHFSTADNADAAADLADPDHDGVTNLMEYAFNLDPKKSDLGSLPVVKASDGELVIEFTAPETVTGILYGASTATSPAGPWQALPDEGVAPLHRFHIPMDRGQGFMRLEIGTAP